MNRRLSEIGWNEIKARFDASSAGPWYRSHEAVLGKSGELITIVGHDPQHYWDKSFPVKDDKVWSNSRFIAASHEDVRRLLIEIRTLWEQLK